MNFNNSLAPSNVCFSCSQIQLLYCKEEEKLKNILNHASLVDFNIFISILNYINLWHRNVRIVCDSKGGGNLGWTTLTSPEQSSKAVQLTIKGQHALRQQDGVGRGEKGKERICEKCSIQSSAKIGNKLISAIMKTRENLASDASKRRNVEGLYEKLLNLIYENFLY